MDCFCTILVQIQVVFFQSVSMNVVDGVVLCSGNAVAKLEIRCGSFVEATPRLVYSLGKNRETANFPGQACLGVDVVTLLRAQ
jgi:hypothetical protein